MIDCRQFQTWLEETGFARAFEIIEPDDLSNVPMSSRHESDQFLEHLAQCTSCSRQWRDAQETWLAMADALDPLPVDSRLESTIMSRALDSLNPEEASEETVVSPRKTGRPHELTVRSSLFAKAEFWRYIVAAMVLAAMVIFVIVRPMASQLGGSKPTAEELAAIKELAHQMDRLDELQHAFGSPELHFVSFQSTDASQKIHGYFVCDVESREGHFFGFDLNFSSDQIYKLFLLDESGKIMSSTVIDIEIRKSLGAAVIKLPEDANSLKEAIVTIEEPADVGVDDSHSGRIVMRTKIAL